MNTQLQVKEVLSIGSGYEFFERLQGSDLILFFLGTQRGQNTNAKNTVFKKILMSSQYAGN